MQHRRLQLIAAIAAITLSAVGLSGCSSSAKSSSTSSSVTELPLAATMELSGPAASTGIPWSRGIELAVKEANGKNGFLVAGKRYKWKLDMQDNQGVPDQAIAQARSFIGKNERFIVGPTLSTSFIPAFNSLGNSSAIMLTASSLASTLKPGAGQSIFVTRADGALSWNDSYAEAVIKKAKPKSVAIMLPQNATGDSFVKIYGDYFQQQGVKVVLSRQFPPETTNFAPYISALRAANPDLVLTGYLDSFVRPLLSQSVSSGFTSANWMMTVGSTEPMLVSTAGPIKQLYFPVPVKSVVDPSDPATKVFRSLWKSSYGKDPEFNDTNALAYYDPVLILTKALQQAKSVDSVAKVSAQMTKVTSWPGAASSGGFDPKTHVRLYPVTYGVVANGKATFTEVKQK